MEAKKSNGKREELLGILDRRDCVRRVFAPLADSAYAASVVGRKWVSEATVEDQIEAGLRCGYHPLFNQYLQSHLQINPAIEMKVELVSESADGREYRQIVETPKGNLVRKAVEQPCRHATGIGEWVESPDHFPMVEWLCDDILAGNRDAMMQNLRIFFAKVPNTITLANEKYYQTIFYTVFTLIGAMTEAEVSTNIGRIDAVVKTAKDIFVFEFKLGGDAESALRQIREKRYAERFLDDGRRVTLIGVGFSASERNIAEWLVESVET